MMGLTRLAERLTSRRWTAADADAFAGPVRRACVAHATDESVRGDAASGGAVTGLLLALLASGAIDGALVCTSAVEDGRVRARYRIASTRDELLAARGSTYVLGDFVREGLPLLEAHPGRIAVVGLPCEITALAHRPDLAAKVPLRISLFCGHASTPGLVDHIVEEMAAEAGGARLVAFRFRTGHWRGVTRATFADGTVVERPFGRFGLYQNLYYFAAKKCLFCGDHFGYDADVSAGDLWTQRYKDDPVKHTALLVKTAAGEAAVDAAVAAGVLALADVGVGEVLDGQRRAAPFHFNVSARAQAGARLGVRIPDRVGARVRWHERLAARMALKDFLATETPEGAARVLRTDRRLLKLKLLVFKGLESLS